MDNLLSVDEILQPDHPKVNPELHSLVAEKLRPMAEAALFGVDHYTYPHALSEAKLHMKHARLQVIDEYLNKDKAIADKDSE